MGILLELVGTSWDSGDAPGYVLQAPCFVSCRFAADRMPFVM